MFGPLYHLKGLERRVEKENRHEERMLSMMLAVMQHNGGHNPHRHFSLQDDPTSFPSMGIPPY